MHAEIEFPLNGGNDGSGRPLTASINTPDNRAAVVGELHCDGEITLCSRGQDLLAGIRLGNFHSCLSRSFWRSLQRERKRALQTPHTHPAFPFRSVSTPLATA